MHVVIVGCGRVGSALSVDLVERGHSVVLIDRRPEAFGRLAESFTSPGSSPMMSPGTSFGPSFGPPTQDGGDAPLGRTLVGIGFDRDVLIEAGVEHADAVAAVTSGDNTNILVARVARENFGIERVVARIYDPKRAAVYQRLGIATVATVSWTTERVLRRVLPSSTAVEWVDPSANVSLVERQVDAKTAGGRYTEIEAAANVKLVAVSRLGIAVLATPDLVAQEGDLMYLAVASEKVDDLAAVLAKPVAHSH